MTDAELDKIANKLGTDLAAQCRPMIDAAVEVRFNRLLDKRMELERAYVRECVRAAFADLRTELAAARAAKPRRAA